MAEHLVAFLAPIGEKIEFYKNNSSQVEQIMEQGSDKARAVAAQTLAEVREAVKI
jgi:tryptophanyl-tRNA synthetase